MSEPEGSAPLAPPGWYEMPGRRGKRCYWDGSQWAPWVGSPAWYDVPGEPGLRRYWDGQRWTDRYRRRERAATRWLLALIALAAAGIVTMFWGGRLAFREPELPMTSASAPGCADAALADFIAPLWLPWLVLVALLAVGALVTIRHGRTDYRMYLLLGPGALAVALTFPVWVFILSGMGCAR
jgi:hypothetical protein